MTEPAPPSPLTEIRASLETHRDLVDRLGRALEQIAESGTWTDWSEIGELHRLGRQILEDEVIARLRAVERVGDAIGRLSQLGPVSEIVDQAPARAADAVGLERVLLSRVEDGALVAEALHVGGDPHGAAAILGRLRLERVELGYPMVEGEILRRRRPLLVQYAEGRAHAHHAFGDALAWRDYVSAPVVLEGRVAGLFHGDRGRTGVPVTVPDRDALWTFAEHFAAVYERALLRRRLRTQREEMRQMASWADARTSELNDRAISLAPEREPAAPETHAGPASDSEAELRELLTRRELDVLELMVKGDTNAGIARALVVAEGTVKFHVKNILRKLGVANRAEAASRYLRLTLREH